MKIGQKENLDISAAVTGLFSRAYPIFAPGLTSI